MTASDSISDPILKQCRVCKRWLSRNLYFHQRTRSIDGYRHTCKDCLAIQRGFNPRKRYDIPDGMRRCSHCGNIYPATTEYFYTDKRSPSGLRTWCKSCHLPNAAKNARNWNRAHPERHAEGSARHRAKYPEKAKALQLAHERRALALPNDFDADDWNRALAYFKGCCAVCGRPVGLWHTLAADHWIPLSSPDCPGTIPTNIVPLCHGIDGCNNSKSDKKPAVWLAARFGARKARTIEKRINAYFASLKDEGAQ